MHPFILAALMHAARAQTYPNVADLTPFTQPANYMSLRGALRLRYVAAGGSRQMPLAMVDRAIAAQAQNVGPALSGATDETHPTKPASGSILQGTTGRWVTREELDRLTEQQSRLGAIDVAAFTQPANFMSLRGYARWKYRQMGVLVFHSRLKPEP